MECVGLDAGISSGSFLSPRTELHFNHLAENSAFGILPQSKVTSRTWLCWEDACAWRILHFLHPFCWGLYLGLLKNLGLFFFFAAYLKRCCPQQALYFCWYWAAADWHFNMWPSSLQLTAYIMRLHRPWRGASRHPNTLLVILAFIRSLPSNLII